MWIVIIITICILYRIWIYKEYVIIDAECVSCVKEIDASLDGFTVYEVEYEYSIEEVAYRGVCVVLFKQPTNEKCRLLVKKGDPCKIVPYNHLKLVIMILVFAILYGVFRLLVQMVL